MKSFTNKMSLRTLLSLAIIMLASVCTCCANNWQRADVYLIAWDVMSRESLTPQRVRELAKAKRTFEAQAPDIARILAIANLKPVKEHRAEDARLVVDLYTDTGARITYYASRFNLCTLDSKSKRPIDEKFRKHFTTLAK